MRKRIESRLTILKQEYEKGRVEIENLDKQRAYLQEIMLRLSGAILVLEELLADNETSTLQTSNSDQTSASTDEKK
jgi:hypothetical protein